ncbi:PstS family phosphate ABC transporter substrate-binding protein [Luteimonas sp. R10]|uniref:PstS family phosphate ABC transporter substrate-binding protein n=1 Tax=Luteimonas sp. R10 TaxID=3108176 RepID=UPI003092C793|nr:substrate-binding domain-containing protein [Luteimonas sp. R10]
MDAARSSCGNIARAGCDTARRVLAGKQPRTIPGSGCFCPRRGDPSKGVFVMRRTSFLRFHPLVIAAAAMAAAGSANAVDLYGGGATFPVQSYVGDDFLLTTPRARLSRNTTNPVATTPIAGLTPPDTVFARFSAGTSNLISYCQTGSGTGKTVLLGVGSVTSANGECNNYNNYGPFPAGFSGLVASPDYIGTDSPITQADATSFTGGPRAARVGLWQIPTLAGAIALPRHEGLNFPNLTTAQVCAIFSARITSWSAIPGSGSSAPIHVVFRSDGSGTSFAFTRYLADACNGNFGIPVGYFTPNQSFAAAVPAVGNQPNSVAPFYAASTAASGNPNVVTQAVATANSIGYGAYPEVHKQGAEFPTVNNASPASLPTSISIPAPLSGMVLNASNTPTPVTGLPNPTCLRLVNPRTIPAGVAYPILAYTYMAGYRNDNAAKTTPLRNLLGYFLSTESNRPAPPAGFAYLDGNAAYRTSVQNTINSCIL